MGLNIFSFNIKAEEEPNSHKKQKIKTKQLEPH